MTGSACSVVGPSPSRAVDFVYDDPGAWTDPSLVTMPNEVAKLMSER